MEELLRKQHLIFIFSLTVILCTSATSITMSPWLLVVFCNVQVLSFRKIPQLCYCVPKFHSQSQSNSNEFFTEHQLNQLESELLQDEEQYSFSSPDPLPLEALSSVLSASAFPPSSNQKQLNMVGDYGFDPLRVSVLFDPFSRKIILSKDETIRVEKRPRSLVLR